MKRADYKKIIYDFVEGKAGPWEWDDFISIESRDDILNLLREYCSNVQLLYPGNQELGEYCDSLGAMKLIEAGDAYGKNDESFETWLAHQEKR